jgi:hypothetical protein
MHHWRMSEEGKEMGRQLDDAAVKIQRLLRGRSAEKASSQIAVAR